MYKYDDISYEQIFSYINKFNSIDNELLAKLRENSEKNKVPIIKIDVENYMRTILNILKPKKILELGCAVGYSSIFMSKTLNDNVEIDTLEMSIDMFEQAKENFEKFSLSNINIVYGNALDTLPTINKKYDFVFMDAGKGHYDEFFNLIVNKLEKNAVIICDNILYKGLLCVDKTQIPRRHKTIYNRMTIFLENIKRNNDISYNLLPLGDGLLVIYFN